MKKNGRSRKVQREWLRHYETRRCRWRRNQVGLSRTSAPRTIAARAARRGAAIHQHLKPGKQTIDHVYTPASITTALVWWRQPTADDVIEPYPLRIPEYLGARCTNSASAGTICDSFGFRFPNPITLTHAPESWLTAMNTVNKLILQSAHKCLQWNIIIAKFEVQSL